MAKMVICEFCGNEVKTQAKTSFRCCSVEQLIETHLKKPKNQNKATIKKKAIDIPKVNKEEPKMEETKPEETKKEVTQDDILPEEPKEPEPATLEEKTDKNFDKDEVNECSECGETDFPDDAERCPKCDAEFE